MSKPRVNALVEQKTYDDLKKYCEKHNVSQTAIVDAAINVYLDSLNGNGSALEYIGLDKKTIEQYKASYQSVFARYNDDYRQLLRESLKTHLDQLAERSRRSTNRFSGKSFSELMEILELDSITEDGKQVATNRMKGFVEARLDALLQEVIDYNESLSKDSDEKIYISKNLMFEVAKANSRSLDKWWGINRTKIEKHHEKHGLDLEDAKSKKQVVESLNVYAPHITETEED